MTFYSVTLELVKTLHVSHTSVFTITLGDLFFVIVLIRRYHKVQETCGGSFLKRQKLSVWSLVSFPGFGMASERAVPPRDRHSRRDRLGFMGPATDLQLVQDVSTDTVCVLNLFHLGSAALARYLAIEDPTATDLSTPVKNMNMY